MQQIDDFQYKRVKERFIWEVIERVQQWRHYFNNGYYDEAGNFFKCNLIKASQLVGIPKKTLEDYSQLLRKASKLVNLEEVKNEKMGYLRRLVRNWKDQEFQSQSQQQMQNESMQQEDDMEEYQSQGQNNWEEMIIQGDNYLNNDQDDYNPFENDIILDENNNTQYFFAAITQQNSNQEQSNLNTREVEENQELNKYSLDIDQMIIEDSFINCGMED